MIRVKDSLNMPIPQIPQGKQALAQKKPDSPKPPIAFDVDFVAMACRFCARRRKADIAA